MDAYWWFSVGVMMKVDSSYIIKIETRTVYEKTIIEGIWKETGVYGRIVVKLWN